MTIRSGVRRVLKVVPPPMGRQDGVNQPRSSVGQGSQGYNLGSCLEEIAHTSFNYVPAGYTDTFFCYFRFCQRCVMKTTSTSVPQETPRSRVLFVCSPISLLPVLVSLTPRATVSVDSARDMWLQIMPTAPSVTAARQRSVYRETASAACHGIFAAFKILLQCIMCN